MKEIYKKFLPTVAVIWAGSFLLLLVVYFLILGPKQRLKSRLGSELAEKRHLYNSALEAAQSDTKVKLAKQIQQLQDRLHGFVIDSEDSANLSFDISKIANEKNVRSFSILSRDTNAGLESKCQYISESYVDVSFNSNFSQFAAFLNSLERHKPVVFVDKFSVIRSDNDPAGHQMRMSLSFFIRRQPSVLNIEDYLI